MNIIPALAHCGLMMDCGQGLIYSGLMMDYDSFVLSWDKGTGVWIILIHVYPGVWLHILIIFIIILRKGYPLAQTAKVAWFAVGEVSVSYTE